MRIKSIEFKNFRKFESKKIDFPERFTVLIGENGSGKSSILEGLCLFLSKEILETIAELSGNKGIHIKKRVQKSHFRYWNDEFDNLVRVSHFKIFSTYKFEDQKERKAQMIYRLGDSGDEGNFSRDQDWSDSSIFGTGTSSSRPYISELQKRIEESKDVVLPIVDYYGVDRNTKTNNETIPFLKNATRLENGYIGAFDTSDVSSFLSWYKTFENEVLKFPSKTFIYEHLQCVKDAIVSVIPEWIDISFSFPQDDLIGTVKNKDGSTNLRYFKDLSDGYRSMVAMVGSIAYRCVRLNPHFGREAAQLTPGVIVIDEIDLHLHPKWQRRIVDDLQAAFPNIQFIATTHSPFIVQSLAEDELINLDLPEEETESQIAPNTMTLGEVVTEVMGVDGIRSNDFDIRYENAKQELEKIPAEDLTLDDYQKISAVLGDLLKEDSSDPVYRAYLEKKSKADSDESDN